MSAQLYDLSVWVNRLEANTAVYSAGTASGTSSASAVGTTAEALGELDLPPAAAEIISTGMASDVTREEIDAKVAAGEARGETKLEIAMGEVRAEFAALRGDIREIKASMASKGTVFLAGVSIFFGIAGLLVAFFAFGGDQFGAGLSTAAATDQAAAKAVAAYAAAHPAK